MTAARPVPLGVALAPVSRSLPGGVVQVPVGAGLVLLLAPASAGSVRARRDLVCLLADLLPAFLPCGDRSGTLEALHARLSADEPAVVAALRASAGACEILLTIEAAAEPAPPGDAACGRDWLRARLARLRVADRRQSLLVAALSALAAELGPPVRASRIIPFASRGGGTGADLALLAERDGAAGLVRRLGGVSLAGCEGRHRVSGPWPCFSFGPGTMTALAGAGP